MQKKMHDTTNLEKTGQTNMLRETGPKYKYIYLLHHDIVSIDTSIYIYIKP